MLYKWLLLCLNLSYRYVAISKVTYVNTENYQKHKHYLKYRTT